MHVANMTKAVTRLSCQGRSMVLHEVEQLAELAQYQVQLASLLRLLGLLTCRAPQQLGHPLHNLRMRRGLMRWIESNLR